MPTRSPNSAHHKRRPEWSESSTAAPAADSSITISERGIQRLKNGHVWVYRSDVVSADGVAPGAVVQVKDSRGHLLGSALYSSSSQIAVRVISSGVVEDFPALLRERVRQAIAYRQPLVRETNAYRVIFSEGDYLPGLIVDRYNEILSVQILTQAMDGEAARSALVGELSERLQPDSIAERVESHIRELEQLPPRASGLLMGEKTSSIFSMNGIQFHYDAGTGQKTGAFLDQRENYAAATQYAYGEALDVFCYQGGFALHLARHCSKVTGVDCSRPALEVADKNATLNQHEVEWIEANAFDLLKDYSAAGQQYDTVVLDPPAFAKNRKNLETAMRGYKELNLRALKMLRPGGTLITCSCSYHVAEGEFLGVVVDAARDARRTLRLLEKRGQAKDHPIVLSVPETGYLKCLILRVT
jgi:23S rRNA (cytosine1962-C5)-methyltransferase